MPLGPNEEQAPRRTNPRLQIENVNVRHSDFRFLLYRKLNHVIVPNSGYLVPGNVLQITETCPYTIQQPRTIRALITYAATLEGYGVDPNYTCLALDFDVQGDTGSTLPGHTPASHELKTDPDVFVHVWAGAKRFEIRKNDRDFKTGDYVVLREFDRVTHRYSGAFVRGEIRHMITDHPALAPGVVSLSLDLISRSKQKPGLSVAT